MPDTEGDSGEERGEGRAGRVVSAASLALLLLGGAYLYGRFSHINGWFPEPLTQQAAEGAGSIRDQITGELPNYLVRAQDGPRARVSDAAAMAPGLTLISTVDADRRLEVALIDTQGRRLHRWPVDWFEVWPDARHVPADLLPKERPGTEIEGFHLAANGDLTFNYEDLGMVQMDICGRVKWRAAKLTHHSLFVDEAGNFWAPGFIDHREADPRFVNYRAPFREYTIVQVAPDGRLLREISIHDVLVRNHLQGALYLTTRDNWTTAVGGDTLHLNDVDVFPVSMAAGVAHAGDVMVSLRNINTVLIFDPKTLAVRATVRDHFVRQHDPDFVDGDRITVFDNNNVSDRSYGAASRLVQISLADGGETTLFAGDPAHPFYSKYMGRSQALPTGGHLLVEAAEGRMLEVGPDGRVVWEYRNHLGDGLVGQLFDGHRVDPAVMNPAKLAALSARCAP